ncbi:MAG: SDR family NAD(P)-dependent oxidoreductase [Pseudomonadota bacterium]
MVELTGKVALITGASRGIGAAAARSFSAAGAKVVLAARSTGQIESVASEIQSRGGEALAVACDVSDYTDVKTLIDQALAFGGRLDILVNNAGVIDPIARLADSDPEAWTKAADINYKGVYFGLRAAIPVMEQQGGGVIVNISSGAATSALEGWSHYCSSKAAALSLTKCAHAEVADKGVRVVGLSPGTVATDMQVAIKASGVNPVSTLEWSDHIPPEWVAQAIVWLSSDTAKDIAGEDFILRDPDNRRRVGLPAG